MSEQDHPTTGLTIVLEGFDPDFTGDGRPPLERLKSAFGVDENTARRFVENMPVVVKRGASKELARNYVRTLHKIGAQVRVDKSPETSKNAAPPPPMKTPLFTDAPPMSMKTPIVTDAPPEEPPSSRSTQIGRVKTTTREIPVIKRPQKRAIQTPGTPSTSIRRRKRPTDTGPQKAVEAPEPAAAPEPNLVKPAPSPSDPALKVAPLGQPDAPADPFGHIPSQGWDPSMDMGDQVEALLAKAAAGHDVTSDTVRARNELFKTEDLPKQPPPGPRRRPKPGSGMQIQHGFDDWHMEQNAAAPQVAPTEGITVDGAWPADDEEFVIENNTAQLEIDRLYKPEDFEAAENILLGNAPPPASTREHSGAISMDFDPGDDEPLRLADEPPLETSAPLNEDPLAPGLDDGLLDDDLDDDFDDSLDDFDDDDEPLKLVDESQESKLVFDNTKAANADPFAMTADSDPRALGLSPETHSTPSPAPLPSAGSPGGLGAGLPTEALVDDGPSHLPVLAPAPTRPRQMPNPNLPKQLYPSMQPQAVQVQFWPSVPQALIAPFRGRGIAWQFILTAMCLFTACITSAPGMLLKLLAAVFAVFTFAGMLGTYFAASVSQSLHGHFTAPDLPGANKDVATDFFFRGIGITILALALFALPGYASTRVFKTSLQAPTAAAGQEAPAAGDSPWVSPWNPDDDFFDTNGQRVVLGPQSPAQVLTNSEGQRVMVDPRRRVVHVMKDGKVSNATSTSDAPPPTTGSPEVTTDLDPIGTLFFIFAMLVALLYLPMALTVAALGDSMLDMYNPLKVTTAILNGGVRYLFIAATGAALITGCSMLMGMMFAGALGAGSILMGLCGAMIPFWMYAYVTGVQGHLIGAMIAETPQRFAEFNR